MWDKRKIAFDKRKPIRRNFLGFGAVVAVFAILLTIVSILVRNNAKTENLIDVDVTISAISDITDDGLTISVNESDKVYIVNKETAESSKVREKLEIGENYHFYITAVQQDRKDPRIFEIIKDNEVVFSIVESERLASEVCAYISGGLYVVAAVLFGVYVYLKRNPKYIENSMAELVFVCTYRFDIVTKKKAEPMSWKRRIAFILIDMGIALAFAGAGIAMIIIANIFGEAIWMSVLKIIFFVSMIVVPPFSLFFFQPMYSEKNIPLFAENYVKFIKSGPEQKTRSPFTEKGLGYEEEENLEEEIIPYSECKIYVAVAYAKAFCAANIYIITEIRNGEDYFITPLLPEVYKSIKEYKVEVEGLDEALDNLEENIRKHVSKKRVVVMKKDGVEEEHSLDARIATRNYWN